MKRFIAVLLLAVIVFTLFSSMQVQGAGQKPVKGPDVLINGIKVEFKEPPILVNNRTLVPVRGVFENLGAGVEWKAESNSVKVTKSSTIVSMRIGYANATVNGRLVKLDAPPMLVKGTTMVPLRFIAETLRSDVIWNPIKGTANIINIGNRTTASRSTVERNFVVVIDSGHGGREVGARYDGINEKDLNLDISKRLNELLKAEGIRTYMTRDGDANVGLHERSLIANRANADLLVSVHNNAGNPGTTGSMTLYYPGLTNSRGKLSAIGFAAIIQEEMVRGLGSRNLGIIPRPNLAVLRTAKMPAVIAEVGYMSNSNELNRLKAADYRQKAAQALKNGVMRALREI